MNQIPFENWRRVLLDTSILMHYFKALKGGKDKTTVFVKELLDFLVNHQAEKDIVKSKGSVKKVDREFFISAVTVSEIWDSSTEESATRRIISALQSPYSVIVSFDEEIADFINTTYNPLLGKKKLTEFARELSFPEHNLDIGREWISKDVMILGTGHSIEVDVVLTTDRKTMFKAADKLGVFCALAHPGLFHKSGGNFYQYDYQKAKNLL